MTRGSHCAVSCSYGTSIGIIISAWCCQHAVLTSQCDSLIRQPSGPTQPPALTVKTSQHQQQQALSALGAETRQCLESHSKQPTLGRLWHGKGSPPAKALKGSKFKAGAGRARGKGPAKPAGKAAPGRQSLSPVQPCQPAPAADPVPQLLASLSPPQGSAEVRSSLGSLPLAQPEQEVRAPPASVHQDAGLSWRPDAEQLAERPVALQSPLQPAMQPEAALRQQGACSSSSFIMPGPQSTAAMHPAAAAGSTSELAGPVEAAAGQQPAADLAVLTAAARLWVEQDVRACCRHLRSLPDGRQQVSSRHVLWSQHYQCVHRQIVS